MRAPLLLVGALLLAGCGSPPAASTISAALQDDGAPAALADCFAAGLLDADVSGSTLDTFAEQGAVDDEGADVELDVDDLPVADALLADCAEQTTSG
ncbi:hypothetical protein ASG36_07275 [Geodermatophilus sp. Leaf369]|uniref:hypothetical protein n=1 Tax=Geodermatophilus sp. Leaf369 TaxID=1736354 RepID=UPI0006F2013F|nr:hypothetical protein [Geodermatophilus sp. Leaf369]KQS60679.1 hypothetical protein ASG36_07275 [Geodermatophilus sp. Leaf369]